MRVRTDGKKVPLKDDLHDVIWTAFDEFMEDNPETETVLRQFADSKAMDQLTTDLASKVEDHLTTVTK